MCIADGFGDCAKVGCSLPSRERFMFTDLGEAAAFHIIHGEIGLAIEFTYFVNGNDVWMAQTCGGECLGPKSLQGDRSCEPASQDHLNRDDTVQTALARFVDHSHTATRDLFE